MARPRPIDGQAPALLRARRLVLAPGQTLAQGSRTFMLLMLLAADPAQRWTAYASHLVWPLRGLPPALLGVN